MVVVCVFESSQRPRLFEGSLFKASLTYECIYIYIYTKEEVSEGRQPRRGTIEQPHLGLRVLLWESPAAGLSTYPANPNRGLVNL